MAMGVLAGLSAASSMLGPLIGMFKNIEGPRKKREKAEQEAAQRQQQQHAQRQAAAGAQAASLNPQAVAGGGTLPLPSPPMTPQAPVQLPAPPQTQLQQPGPLGGQRNDYLMKMLMQGNR